MNTWVDLPITQAMDYFGKLLTYFLWFSTKIAGFIAFIGLVWSAFQLANSRMNIKQFWWDTIYKWLLYFFIMSFYVTGTYALQALSNQIALNAGNAKESITECFADLQKSIQEDVNTYRSWLDGADDILSKYLSKDGSVRKYINEPGKDAKDLTSELFFSLQYGSWKKLGFDSKKDYKNAMEEMKKYSDKLPSSDASVFGEQTLEALNQVLIRRDENGNITTDLTNSYVDLDIWLKDENGQDTTIFAPSAIYRIGMLAGKVMWNKSQLALIKYKDNIDEGVDSDGEDYDYGGKWDKFTEKTMSSIKTSVIAGLSFIIILVSVAFAIIQYVMCMLEYTIIQGIGALFIPFTLFDGTKELPKKLVPVFMGFFMKILVMVICMMFIIYLWLVFASEQVAPKSGPVSWEALGYVIFVGLLSFVLTSNAPKIAMTLLTGQPQLSMGELMAAAGTMAGGAMMARNAAGFATSPMTNAAKVKMGEAHQRHQASSAAKKEAKTEYDAENKGKLTSQKPGKDASAEDRKAYNDLKKEYRENRNAAAKSAGQNASDAVRDQQKANYMNNGGALGTAGRMFAHYAGGFTHPVQTLKSGRNYQSPNGMHDFVDIAKIAEENSKNPPVPQIPPDEDERKKKEKKNGLKDNLTGNDRQSS